MTARMHDTPANLLNFKALTFDCYGTLIDWESGMIAGLAPLVEKVDKNLTRNEILQAHARHESTQQRWTPTKKYSELLAIVYRRLAEEWGVSVTWDECKVYGNSVQHWPAFDDSVECLNYLRQHFELIILSNVDNESFAHSQQKLGVEFDAIYTAESIGSYKPNDRNFDYMLEALAHKGINKSDILHTAESLFHDHVPANRHGLRSCWIYRRHDQDGFGATMDPGNIPDIDFRYTSLIGLVDAHKEALRVGT